MGTTYLYGEKITAHQMGDVSYNYLYSSSDYKNGVGRILNMLDFRGLVNQNLEKLRETAGTLDYLHCGTPTILNFRQEGALEGDGFILITVEDVEEMSDAVS